MVDSPASLPNGIGDGRLGGFMEVAELKGVINELEARVEKIRDWL